MSGKNVVSKKKVLATFIDQIKNRASNNHYQSSLIDSIASVGMVDFARRTSKGTGTPNKLALPAKDIKHVLYVTKRYPDSGCALYKLIRYVESILPQEVGVIFWRVEPSIIHYTDFDFYSVKFFGRIRFSFIEE